jgi:hypothetical protein
MTSAGDVRRAWRWGLFPIGVVLVYLLVVDSGSTAYDDSYFFKRFAVIVVVPMQR